MYGQHLNPWTVMIHTILDVVQVLLVKTWQSGFLKASVYAIRVYGHSLGDEEIFSNYEKTIDFHSKIKEWVIKILFTLYKVNKIFYA